MSKLDEQIQAACGSVAPDNLTEQQKENWLRRETEAQRAKSPNKSLPIMGGAAGYTSQHHGNQYNDGRVPQLQQRRVVLLAYLREKLADDDMHGVQDAASDIREIDAKLSVLRA